MPTPLLPSELARRVAAILQLLGAKVRVEHALAGTRVDVFAEQLDSSGRLVRTAVECKAYSAPVPGEVILARAGVAALLKQRHLVDRVLVVAAAGFTSGAVNFAAEYEIDLLTLADLEARLGDRLPLVESVLSSLPIGHTVQATSKTAPKNIFAVMPFAREFDDVYILGVRDVAEKLDLVVQRADDIEHNENILSIIQTSIQDADIIVGDTTTRNPNCFYEIGFAHALKKPTVLICRSGEDIPFDLRSLNHIFYASIVELRQLLAQRLTAMVGARR